MKEILLKDYDNSDTLAILTIPEGVNLEDVKEKIFALKDKWLSESDLTLIEYLTEHSPWKVTVPQEDDRDVIYV